MCHVASQIRCRPAHRLLLELLFAAMLLPASACTAEANPSLKTITTVREAHNLTLQEAVRGYPVHLRGVVTFYEPVVDPKWISLFLKDSTASIFVAVPKNSPVRTPTGTLVDVRGVSAVGDFAPIIAQATVAPIGSTLHLPPAPRVTLARLLSGAEDGQWVEVTGVLRSVFLQESHVILQLAMDDGFIGILTPRQPGTDYMALIDATVRVHANAAPLFNDERQMIGARLLMPGLSALQILQPPAPDPFALPVTAIRNISQFNPLGATPHRLHLRGRITLVWPGNLICIQQETQQETRGLCAHTFQTTNLPLGSLVDLVGFAASGSAAPILTDATFRPVADTSSATFAPLTGRDILLVKSDARLVRLQGELLATDRSATETTLLLSSGGTLVTAVLPTRRNEAKLPQSDGSILELTGISSVLVDTERSARTTGSAVPKSFRLLLRSPNDIVVLKTPSWWSPDHALKVAGFALGITLLVLVWVAALRRRVHQQTELIRESEEKFRYLALHDTLTGLATRLLLSERLEAALARIRGGECLAILMLDVDCFKSINDQYGHSGGDRVLRTTADRLAASVRRDDTVARIGGDEFVVLLSDVTASQAEEIAAMIVRSLSNPVDFDHHHVPVTVSVGVCMASGHSHPDALLRSADEAMYRAKAKGKHCFQVVGADLVSA